MLPLLQGDHDGYPRGLSLLRSHQDGDLDASDIMAIHSESSGLFDMVCIN